MKELKLIKKALLLYIAATILEKVLKKKSDEKMWENAMSFARQKLDLELALIKPYFQPDE
ncbi:hypothetical protein TP70_02185 [Staphylococcus microti]|uniref:Uncharacterized protein n=1 Tax=Staphylococcus microti TaxID=569857 RepID=A0A0D6XS76_9STAP|nr:hypothetical protein [Staphylococcus microti]KIX91442.1 hypothetical protein TP70_02185 [Staphylococcus microti]PNZ82493.1 hypothetical protein CD132_04135 [Staphylococcus microti]PNZ83678.1 hypothetical protein CD132_02005 [Staphylococcus microti]SUM57016.1 Uncharacterised protein [Staphylococcus microti]